MRQTIGQLLQRRTVTGLSLAADAIILFAIACGGDSEAGDGAGDKFDANADPRLEGIMGQLSDFEAEILQDGRVSEGEYEKAVLATMQCLDDKGIPHSDPVWSEDGRFPQWDYTVGPWPDADELAELGGQCESEFLDDVAIVWSLQHEETEAQQEARRSAFLSCLREAGVEAPDYQTFVSAIEPQLKGAELASAIKCRESAFRGAVPE